MQGRGNGRLKFHTWSGSVVILVLALVLSETLVESQYYFTQNVQPGPTRSQYYFYDDQSFFPGGFAEEGRAFPSGGGGDAGVAGGVSEQSPEENGRMFASRSGRAASDEEDDEEEEMMPASSKISVSLPAGRARPVKLPKGFNDRVHKRIKMSRKSKTRLHGDPDPIDDEDEEGRKPEARLLWPFSIEITKGQKDKGGWGGPGGYGSYDGPPPRTGLGFGVGVNSNKFGFDLKHGLPPKQYARIGFTKGRHPNDHHHPHRDRAHFSVSGGYGPQNGWGWDAFIEHEKHRLKYEILKLKAKKKIAVLQNKVELKKLFSMLLQKKIQALEWW